MAIKLLVTGGTWRPETTYSIDDKRSLFTVPGILSDISRRALHHLKNNIQMHDCKEKARGSLKSSLSANHLSAKPPSVTNIRFAYLNSSYGARRATN
jgi:hypothetical protein